MAIGKKSGWIRDSAIEMLRKVPGGSASQPLPQPPPTYFPEWWELEGLDPFWQRVVWLEYDCLLYYVLKSQREMFWDKSLDQFKNVEDYSHWHGLNFIGGAYL